MVWGYEVSIGRRLPVYLLLDTSRSMRGAPIQAVNDGLRILKDALLDDPVAVEIVYISVITFSTEAEQVVPLTELLDFSPPELSAGGWSAMGAALRLLNEVLDREVTPNTPDRKGDYKPLAFLMTDGRSSDGWKRASKALRNRPQVKLASLIALGCGPKADMETLSQIADVALSMEQITSESICSFFQWISQSVGAASMASSAAEEGLVDLPPLPSHICRIVL